MSDSAGPGFQQSSTEYDSDEYDSDFNFEEDCWEAPALDDVDRLSTLPPELLHQICHFVGEMSYERYPKPLVLTKALWPYSRPLLYHITEVRSWKNFLFLMRTLCSNLEICKSIVRLTISLERPSEDPTPDPDKPETYRLPVEPAKFWTAFPKLFRVDLFGCFDLSRTLLELGPATEAELPALEMIDLRDDFDQWTNPYSPEHYNNLFRLAPKLRSFELIVRRKLNRNLLSAAPKAPRRLRDQLDELTLIGPVTVASDEVAELCHAFGSIKELFVSEELPPMNYSSLVGQLVGVTIDKLTLSLSILDQSWAEIDASEWDPNLRPLDTLRTLQLDLPTAFDRTLVGTLPTSLVHLEFSIFYEISPTNLIFLVYTQLDQLPNLKTITADRLPGGKIWVKDSAKRGPLILGEGEPVLRVDESGRPVFEPLPGWKLPEWDEGEFEFGMMMDAIEVAKEKGVELKGGLVEVTRIRQEWGAEKELCEELEEVYDSGELEWRPWIKEEDEGELSSEGEEEDQDDGSEEVASTGEGEEEGAKVGDDVDGEGV